MFQTDAPLLHHLKAEVMKILKEILSDFIQVEVGDTLILLKLTFINQETEFQLNMCTWVYWQQLHLLNALTVILLE